MAKDMDNDAETIEDAAIEPGDRVDEGFKETAKKIGKILGKGTLLFLEAIGRTVLWLLGHPSVILSVGSIVAMLYGYYQVKNILGGAASVAKEVLQKIHEMPKNAKELLPPTYSAVGPEMQHAGAASWEQMVTPGGMDSFQQMALGI